MLFIKNALKSAFRYPCCPYCEERLPRKSYLLKIYGAPVICPNCGGLSKVGQIKGLLYFLGLSLLILSVNLVFEFAASTSDKSSLSGLFVYGLIFLVTGIPYLFFIQPLFITFKKIG